MKTITLLPAKNEDWIIEYTLKNIVEFSDHVIISDQHSTDTSPAIYEKFPKVTVIENNNRTHNNSVRWDLLDKARKLFGTGNLIVCIDADEFISKEIIEQIKTTINTREDKNVSFSFKWVQLWGSLDEFRNDGVWKDNNKIVAFFDDGLVNYEKTIILNDHTSRTPKCKSNIHISTQPLLHFQYLNLKQSEIKRAWYQCSELISGMDPRRINLKYSQSKNCTNVKLSRVPQGWHIPSFKLTPYDTMSDWRYKEIISQFDNYGIGFFEPLDIWNIPELKQAFCAFSPKEPNIKTYPSWLILAKKLFNYINNLIK